VSKLPQKQSEDSTSSTTAVHKKPCSIALTRHLAKRSAQNLTERTGKVYHIYYCDRHEAYHVEEV